MSGRMVALECARSSFRLYSGVAPPFGRTFAASPIAALMGADNPASTTRLHLDSGERVIVGKNPKEKNSKLIGVDEMPMMWMLRQLIGQVPVISV